MKNIAVIKNGVVTNVAVWNGDAGWWDVIQNDGFILVDVTTLTNTDGSGIGIGSAYDGTNFTAPGGD
jgi:hypothetical protein